MTTPPAARKRRKPAVVGRSEYPPGYFLAPVRAWVGPFGPLWEPRAFHALPLPRPQAAGLQQGNSHAERERRAQTGVGWGAGTIALPRTPGHRRPGWMTAAGGDK